MITLYGISNCDTVKKARRWLDDQGIAHQFHDFRKDGLNTRQIQQWLDQLGWETLINKRSTSWKQLTPDVRDSMNNTNALDAIAAMPTLIKRPLLDTGSALHVGFKADHYSQLFAELHP